MWGLGRAAAGDAAFINGIASHVLDFDDALPTMRGHPSATMVPVALALAEQEGRTVEEMLTACALGLEVAGKIGKALGDEHYFRGWHATATIGVFSATAVAARLLRLDAGQLKQAWGIAASQAAGLVRNFGTMTKSFHVGHTARSAILAASLAQHGFTADSAIFDGPNGFLQTYGASGEPPEALIAKLGAPWDAVDPGINVKQWPCCYCSHRAIGGLMQMVDRHALQPRDVDGVRIGFPPGADTALIHRHAQSGLEGKFSVEYAAAATLLDGNPQLGSFTDDAVARPAAQALMRKIERYRVPDTQTYSGTVGYTDVEIRARGATYAARIDKTPGSLDWPLSPAEQRAKFAACAGPILGAAGAHEMFDMIQTAPGSTAAVDLLRMIRTSA